MSMFGKRLRLLRREKDITMVQLASYLGTTQPTISKYERGLHEPDVPMVKMIAEYFNVSTDYIVGNTDKREPYDPDGEDFVHKLKEEAKKQGHNIDDMSNEEIANMLMRAIKLEEIYKSK